MNFGIKYNILRILRSLGCAITVGSRFTSAHDVLAQKPTGFFCRMVGRSGRRTYAIEAVRQLIGKVPIFGICLGHQILGLAMGAKPINLNSATEARTIR